MPEGVTAGGGEAAHCRVVVCDDVDDYRELLVILLERTGRLSVVGEAANGSAAIEVVRLQQPDVVLLDLAMPMMDGMEALPLIRSAAPATRVIVLTGFASEALRRKALERGAVEYLEKGSPLATVIEAVISACGD